MIHCREACPDVKRLRSAGATAHVAIRFKKGNTDPSVANRTRERANRGKSSNTLCSAFNTLSYCDNREREWYLVYIFVQTLALLALARSRHHDDNQRPSRCSTGRQRTFDC